MNQTYSLRNFGADLIELLGSMRFAVSLLMFICVASIIGTVLAQNQVANSYIDQFGPFWFELFDKFAIWHVYNSWWFLLIMAFLVVSTSICLMRNTPKMLRDMRSFREYVRGSSLRAFHHRVEAESTSSPDQALQKIGPWLEANGYKYKTRHDGDSVMLAAKKGAANRLGYIFAHAAIVIIAVGGLLDSELPVRLQVWLGGKAPITQNMLISEVPASGRLSAANPSYRSNMLLPEGSRSASGIVAFGDGVLVQPLPFSIKLNKFEVSYYSTGMPSSFKSYVEVNDPDTGETFESLIEVNEPLRYKGVTVYQSSLDDGGSHLQLTAYPLKGAANQPFQVEGTVGKNSEITLSDERGAQQDVVVDMSGLRVINVENMAPGTEPQPKAMIEHVASVTGSAAGASNEHLRNVGPSVQYRVIGADGQAHEFNNYMLPIELDGHWVFLAGVRQSEAEDYRYMRIPADADQSLAEFMHLRAALQDPALRELAATRFAEHNAANEAQRPLLQKAAMGAIDAFARQGFNALIERVPEADRESVLGFAVPMVQLTLTELYDIDRTRRGLQTNSGSQEGADWLRLSLLALANLPEYPAPIFLSLNSFKEVPASVFQIARSPGKNTVYLGCLFLVLGVFSMFYIRDRRIWVWITPNAGGSRLQAAMTSQRRNLDFNQEFERFRDAFRRLTT